MDKKHVFLSYCRDDRDAVTDLRAELIAGHERVWWDQDILGGQTWLSEIRSAMKSAYAVVICLTKNVAARTQSGTYPEILDAVEAYRQYKPGSIFLIPVRLSECDIPDISIDSVRTLDSVQHIDLFPSARYQAGLESLLRAIRATPQYTALSSAASRGGTTPGRPETLPAWAERTPPMQFQTGGARPIRPTILLPDREISVLGRRYVRVDTGEVSIGADQGYPGERPRHRVRLSPFFLAACPVTNRDFYSFVKATGYVTEVERYRSGYCCRGGRWVSVEDATFYRPSGLHDDIAEKADYPVVQVSWDDARTYCSWLSGESGFQFSLPTEAQWECAAAGKTGRKWAYGDTYSTSDANTEGRDTNRVGSYPCSPAGLYDITGNVQEWCMDWYADGWLAAGHDLPGATVDPSGPRRGSERVLRGGSWADSAENSRCSNRFQAAPILGADNRGFRCALLLDTRLRLQLEDSRQWQANDDGGRNGWRS